MVQKSLGGFVPFVTHVIKEQASPGTVLHIVVELGVVSLAGLVQIRRVVEEGPDGDENYEMVQLRNAKQLGRLSPHSPELQFMLNVHGSPGHVPSMLRHTVPSV